MKIIPWHQELIRQGIPEFLRGSVWTQDSMTECSVYSLNQTLRHCLNHLTSGLAKVGTLPRITSQAPQGDLELVVRWIL